MVLFEFTVKDENGLHARPAGLLVKEAMKCKSSVTLKKGIKKGDAKKIFNVMGLSVKHGDIIQVEVEGDSEENDAKLLKDFITENIWWFHIKRGDEICIH